MSARRPLQPGYVLHHRAYRETSALLELLTREGGRIGAVARGARRPRSRWRGALVPFTPLLLAFAGRGDLVTVTALEPAARGWRLQGTVLLGGFYLNELLIRLLARHDPHPGLFDAYHQTLAALDAGEPLEERLRVFEKQLLDEIGYGLELTRTVDRAAPIRPGIGYRYLLGSGPTAAGGSGEGIPVSGETLLALHAGRLAGPRERREAKRLLRAALAEHLGARPLASRELLARLGQPPGERRGARP